MDHVLQVDLNGFGMKNQGSPSIATHWKRQVDFETLETLPKSDGQEWIWILIGKRAIQDGVVNQFGHFVSLKSSK